MLCRDRRLGLYLDYSQSHSRKRLTCINTAFELFQQVGAPIYKEALSIIMDVWGGEPDSLRAEVVQGVIGFVALYHGEYDRKCLVNRFRKTDPLTIYREGSSVGTGLPSSKRYLYVNTKKFHYPSCSSVNQMSDKNKQTYTGNRDDLISQGYDPCKKCNP